MVLTTLKVTNVMDTGWYKLITLFVLLTNYVFLFLLFTSMVCHGYTLDGFNIATIQPLVKTTGIQQITLLTIEPLLLVAPWRKYLIGL